MLTHLLLPVVGGTFLVSFLQMKDHFISRSQLSELVPSSGITEDDSKHLFHLISQCTGSCKSARKEGASGSSVP